MNWVGELVQEHVKETDTVLDLGCGNMGAIGGVKCKTLVGVDAWYPYVNSLKRYAVVLCMNVNRSTINYFVNKSFDFVTLLDFVEHLEKEEAFEIIKHAERIARKKVIILTPKGYLEQEDGEDNSWGMGNPKYQSHKCGFEIKELEMMNYKITFHPSSYRGKKITMLFAVKNMEDAE